jgi:hypothetical protein
MRVFVTGASGWDMPAASDRTCALLGWAPEQHGLLADLAPADYFGS